MVSLTNYMSYRITSLNHVNERISKQMASGRQIDVGSDDSRLYATDLDIKDKIRIYSGLKDQLVSTTAFNSVSDTTVGQIKNQVGNLKTALSKALGNDQLRGPAEREINKANLKSIRQTMLTLANTRINGEYLFSGIDTTIKPMVGDDDANFEETGKVNYNGKEELRTIAVEPGTYRQRGITAKDLFLSKEVYQKGEIAKFDRDDEIIDDTGHTWIIYHDRDTDNDLSNDTKELRRKDDSSIKFDIEMVDPSKPYKGYKMKVTLPHDDDSGSVNIKSLEVKHNVFDDIQTAIMALDDKVYDYGNSDNVASTKYIDGDKDNYTDILNYVSSKFTDSADSVSVAHAKLGSRNKTFDLASTRIDQKITHFTIFQEQVTGVDYAKASMELKSLELTYQAMFSTITKLNDMSLVKFMK